MSRRVTAWQRRSPAGSRPLPPLCQQPDQGPAPGLLFPAGPGAAHPVPTRSWAGSSSPAAARPGPGEGDPQPPPGPSVPLFPSHPSGACRCEERWPPSLRNWATSQRHLNGSSSCRGLWLLGKEVRVQEGRPDTSRNTACNDAIGNPSPAWQRGQAWEQPGTSPAGLPGRPAHVRLGRGKAC